MWVKINLGFSDTLVMMHHSGILSLLLVFSCHLGLTYASEQVDSAFKEKSDPHDKIKLLKLENGLTLALGSFPDAKKVFLRLRVSSGSSSEEKYGLAHLTEHALFRDIEIEPKTYLDQMRDSGFDSNGITEDYQTVYYISSPAEKLEESFHTLFKVIRPRFFSSELIAKAKSEIELEEGNFRILNLFVRPLINFFVRSELEKEFGIQKKNESIVYFKNPFDELTEKDVNNFYLKHYYPENMALEVVGRVEERQVIDLLGKTFLKIEKSGKSASPRLVLRPSKQNHKLEVVSTGGNRAIFGLKFWDFSLRDEVVLRSYLKWISDYLMKEIRSREGKTYTVSNDVSFKEGPFGVAYLTLELPSENYGALLGDIDNKIKRQTRDGLFEDKEIDEAKQMYARGFYNMDTDVKSLSGLSAAAIFSERYYAEKGSPVSLLDQMSPEEYRSSLKKIFTKFPKSDVSIRPAYFFAHEGLLLFLLSILIPWGLARRGKVVSHQADQIQFTGIIKFSTVDVFKRRSKTVLAIVGYFVCSYYLYKNLREQFPVFESSAILRDYVFGTLIRSLALFGFFKGRASRVMYIAANSSFLFLENKKRQVVRTIPVVDVRDIRAKSSLFSKKVLIRYNEEKVSFPASNADELVMQFENSSQTTNINLAKSA